MCSSDLFDVVGNNLYLIGDINSYSINEVQQAINKLESDKNNTTLNFYLTSEGGDVFEGLKLYDLLQATKLDVTIYISSFVGSAATLPLFSKHKVIMYKNSILGFHELTHYSDKRYSNSKASIELTDRLMDKIITIYNTKTQEITREWLVIDRYLDSDEALRLNIVDEVK